jgi:hypothetical protein
MQYSQAKQKIQKSINNINKTVVEIENKKNDPFNFNFFKSKIKTNSVLYDSGWEDITPDNNSYKTIVHGAMLPASVSIDYSDYFEIPEEILPFIDLQLFVKPVGHAKLATYHPYTLENYTGNYIKVTGDGTLIVQGYWPSQFNRLYDESELGTNINASFTKKVWNTVIEFTSGGDTYRLTGEVNGIIIGENEQTEDSTTIWDEFYCLPTRPSDVEYNHYHKITALSDTQFTGVGDYHDREFNPGPPLGDFSTTYTYETTLTRNFATVDYYKIGVFGILANITQGTSSGLAGWWFDSTMHSLISKEFIFQGYRLYYSDLTQKEFRISSGGSAALQNLPNTSSTPPDVLPYSTLLLEQNPDGFPETTSETTGLFIQSADGTIVNGYLVRKDLSFIKTDDLNNGSAKYLFKFKTGVTILEPAVVDDDDPHIFIKVDQYSQSGTTYALSSSTSDYKSLAYKTEKNDVKYRIVITAKNPIDTNELRKYDLNQ